MRQRQRHEAEAVVRVEEVEGVAAAVEAEEAMEAGT
jgi:hypothetical protein